MDLVGPLNRSTQGHRCVLVIIDDSAGYPEAVPLCSISAKSIAQALLQLINAVGIPKEIVMDQGTLFVTHPPPTLPVIGDKNNPHQRVPSRVSGAL